jgi:predicted O-methyltransferase YrrM
MSRQDDYMTMKLGLVSIQRDRGRWLTEWFAFHYLVGFRQFYFYAHLCTDNTVSVLQRLCGKLSIQGMILSEKMDRIQLSAYQHACENFMDEVDWMAFLDGDEFLFPTRERTLPEALIPFESMPVSAVAVYNVTFGSNGHVEEPEGLITENFRRCCSDPAFQPNRRVKSIVKGHQRISVSACSNVFQTPLGTIDEKGRPVTWGHLPHYEPCYDVLRFNHYPCQSYQYFKSFKSTSGHADAGAEAPRDDDWWKGFDRNEEYDSSLGRFYAELKDLVRWLEDTGPSKNFLLPGGDPAAETPREPTTEAPPVDLLTYKHSYYNESMVKAISPNQPSDISDHLGLLFYFTTDANPKLIVELGTRGGDSTRTLLAAASINRATVLSIDIDDCKDIDVPHPDLWNFVRSDDIAFGASDFCNWCVSHSIDPVIDVIFIDTSHEYEHTKNEIDVWSKYLSPDGVMMFHDTNMKVVYGRTDGSISYGWDNKRGVIRAIEEFVGRQYDENSFFCDLTDKYSLIHFPNCNGLTVVKKRKRGRSATVRTQKSSRHS